MSAHDELAQQIHKKPYDDCDQNQKHLVDKIVANRSRGLGDSIAKVTNALGIPQCRSCAERQEKLNQLFPYKKESK